ncbi:MAG TPA: major facilitator superfamily domain-containing protein 6 [Anaerolineales bacterium]|nr:major facilitator superfamily domain-containing protein 6 [Anaerolineales bacterium]
MKKIWPFTFYFLFFAAIASLLPFFVLFYQGLGFNGAQIGLLTGVPPLITLIAAPLWTGFADAKRRHKFVMGLGMLVSIVAVFWLPSLTGFGIVFIAIILFYIFLSPVSALADSATMTMLGEERAMYGRIRLGGTIGFGLFAPIAGMLVENYGLKIGFWAFSIIMLINFFVSQKFSHGSHEAETSHNRGIRVFLTSRRWINFLFLAFLGGIGATSGASYLFPYMAELGADESTMGLALTIASLTEIPIFFFGNRFVKKFGSYGLLTLALVMLGLRSLLYAAVSVPWLVLIVQVFGGMLFPAMWSAGVSYADEHAPAGLKASAQGLFGAMSFGVGSAFSGFVSGPLLESVGGRGMFLVLGVVILAGLALAEGIRRLFPDKSELPQTIVVSSDK